jgi:hypothetical protein
VEKPSRRAGQLQGTRDKGQLIEGQETEQILKCRELIRKRDEERIVDGQTRNRADAQAYSLDKKSGSQVCYSAAELSNVTGISSNVCKILTFKINNHTLLTLDIN